MKKRAFLVVILVILIAGVTSFYFLWWLPKIQKQKEEIKELALTSPHTGRASFSDWEIEGIMKWKISPEDTAYPSERACIWTGEYINRSLKYVCDLYKCQFWLKDSNDITIATDHFDFGYSGHTLKPGESWEAHGTIFLSKTKALMADYASGWLSRKKEKYLASKETREKRKKEFIDKLNEVKNKIMEEGLYEDPSRWYNVALVLWRLGISAQDTKWGDKIDTIEKTFYAAIAKHQGGEIFTDTLYKDIYYNKILNGWSDKKIWNKLVSSEYKSEYEKAKASGMGDKEIKNILGLNIE